MERRVFIRALAGVPAVTGAMVSTNPDEAKAIRVEPGKYLIFVDMSAIDAIALSEMETPWPDVDIVYIGVYPQPSQTVEECVAMYKLEDQEKS